MSEGVIVCFETVNIQHADRKGNLQAGSLVPFRKAVTIVLPPVGYAGQLIRPGLVFYLPAVIIQFNMRIDPGLYYQRIERLGNVVNRAQNKSPLLILRV